MTPLEDVLFSCLSEKRWRNLSRREFYAQYEEEVGNAKEELLGTRTADFPPFGSCTVHELSNGLAILECSAGFSLYETRDRFQTRRHNALWADFARGYWSQKVPQEPGLYFVKDRDLGRRSVRELKRINGRLIDVTGGQVRPGLVTEYLGFWWMPAIPPLPESF